MGHLKTLGFTDEPMSYIVDGFVDLPEPVTVFFKNQQHALQLPVDDVKDLERLKNECSFA
jgi:hypothetical protein